MSTKKPKKQRHIGREVLGSESDPDAVLASLPIGTSDWIRVLGAILKKHNFKHSKKHKGVGFKTMLDRQRFYASFFRELRRHTPYHNVDPRQLANRHIEAVLARWLDRKLATATIHNYLSFLRTYAAWIGRPGMVRDVATYFGDDSHYVHRDRTANFDRSWIARSVEVEAKIAEVTAYDPWVGIQLELCYHFGLRAKEARHFRPHMAVITRDEANPRDAQHFPDCERFLRVRYGTKGGRPRDIPVQTPEQEALLKRALQSVAPGQYVGAPGRTTTQNANRFYNVLRRFGITKAALGVTAHGLRHQHANDRYEELTGEPSPVRGGSGDGGEDATARLAIASELGHGRIAISDAYLGSSAVMRRKPAARTSDVREVAPDST